MSHKSHLFTTLPIITLGALTAYADEDHDHDHEHDHEHETTYIAGGHVDIALEFHADEAELELALFADDHGHDHEHHDDEHGHSEEDEEGHEHDEEGHEHDEEHAHDEHAEEGHSHDEEYHEEEEHGHHEEDEHGHEEHEHDHDHDHDHGESLDFDETVILAGADTRFVLPESGAFDFLGAPGDIVYILPQDPTAGPPAPGLVSEVEEGIMKDDIVTFSLDSVDGPGDLVVYTVDGFGSVNVIFDSRTLSNGAQEFTVPAESHQHMFWAFTEPGIHHVNLMGSGTSAANELVSYSAEASLMVQVGSGAAYLRHVEAYEDGWAETENLGLVYTEYFPWLYMPGLAGWAYAEGSGGESMFLFSEALNSWLATGDELAPWFYNFEQADWIYVVELPEGIYYYSDSTGLWTFVGLGS